MIIELITDDFCQQVQRQVEQCAYGQCQAQFAEIQVLFLHLKLDRQGEFSFLVPIWYAEEEKEQRLTGQIRAHGDLHQLGEKALKY